MTLFLYLAVLAVGLTLFNILRERAYYRRMQERAFLWQCHQREAQHKAEFEQFRQGMQVWR